MKRWSAQIKPIQNINTVDFSLSARVSITFLCSAELEIFSFLWICNFDICPDLFHVVQDMMMSYTIDYPKPWAKARICIDYPKARGGIPYEAILLMLKLFLGSVSIPVNKSGFCPSWVLCMKSIAPYISIWALPYEWDSYGEIYAMQAIHCTGMAWSYVSLVT